MSWRRIAIIGLGLLGGSLGLAIKKKKLSERVSGYVRQSRNISLALETGVADEVFDSLEPAVANADLIILATPLSEMRALAAGFAAFLQPGTIVTDVGSVKESVVQELEPIIHGSGGYFIGSHPIAGGEKTGPRAARAELFQRKVCVLTPSEKSNSDALARVEMFWRQLGMHVFLLSPQNHDKILSRTSHLPHVIASQLASFVLGLDQPPEHQELCGTGFRDSTRIASSSPVMWRDIAMANRAHLLSALEEFMSQLDNFKSTLQRQDSNALLEFFAKAKERRDCWREKHQSGEASS